MCPEIELELARVVELRFSLAEAVPTPKLAILDATCTGATSPERERHQRHITRATSQGHAATSQGQGTMGMHAQRTPSRPVQGGGRGGGRGGGGGGGGVTFSDPTRSDGSAASEAVSMRLRVWRHVSRSAGEVNLSSRHYGTTSTATHASVSALGLLP
jgi:hypothetical protein